MEDEKPLPTPRDETDSNAKAFGEDFLSLGAKTDLYRCQVRSEHEVSYIYQASLYLVFRMTFAIIERNDASRIID